MFPDMTLSSVPLQGDFVEKVNARRAPLIDYELAGVALGDASSGLQVRLWTIEVKGDDAVLSAEGVAPVVLFSRPGMTEIALAFDQNMRAHVAFVQVGMAWLWWYDSQVNQMVFTSFPGMSNPRLATDEKRGSELSVSDVVLSYMSGGNLCCRIQRERFTVERVLTAAPGLQLVSVAKNAGNRLQWECFPVA
ncbi:MULTISPECIES: hypothetical protein [unclassified Stenotrophomonas]|uniref:hypothetical protein n=1 Tax=unclassified Stenotrophomonas TaxID=196198 RepID=UPI00244CFEE6|nr:MULTISPECIES: hypothetical protein [unclassified Stenotrophomonas]MDH0276394.1 hypothetical protein [Stenotrophomonas sp. GD04089]MDH1911530.1 hypothetical protein [Stenotrophomonas sp. GD03794]